MNRDAVPTLVDVGAENVDKTGFFCFMSKKKSEGYQRKLALAQGSLRRGDAHQDARAARARIHRVHPWRARLARGSRRRLPVHSLPVGRRQEQGQGVCQPRCSMPASQTPRNRE